MTREEKLEAAFRAARKLRQAMLDLNPLYVNFFVPRDSVKEFDEAIEKLKKEME